MSNLGNLEKVDIKLIWPLEPRDFTPWLAKNIDLINAALGLDIDEESLKTVATEQKVGSFSADIVAQDREENRIVIENQFGNTDHDHLGKMITYAAGIGASTIIWVTELAREEHKKAVEWLNSNSTEDINFFLVQIEAWKIGESKPAPRFNVISSPNEWEKTVKSYSRARGTDETSLQKLAFWEKLRSYADTHAPQLRWRTPRPQHWYDLTFGSNVAHISLNVSSKNPPKVTIWWYAHASKEQNKAAFDDLYEKRKEISSELGQKVHWDRADENKYSGFYIEHAGNYKDEEQHEKLIKWLVESTVKFNDTIQKHDATIR